eukprot:Protomagalhaensia_wolfi_Nauph_80__908@NODE_1522_length_1490_cov_14_995176_g1181_i0_p2_GENE_NODE_1522_length_1490_cov_14_995176_g1181_i0NODE_1522_length_1490_cov_14_995176_g1181_i0_p2_ORF_typecomplete_len116_score23_81_NODE_1522_length_1490_cov_14_995176_g1181_i011431490
MRVPSSEARKLFAQLFPRRKRPLAAASAAAGPAVVPPPIPQSTNSDQENIQPPQPQSQLPCVASDVIPAGSIEDLLYSSEQQQHQPSRKRAAGGSDEERPSAKKKRIDLTTPPES